MREARTTQPSLRENWLSLEHSRELQTTPGCSMSILRSRSWCCKIFGRPQQLAVPRSG